jgi:hypothetical protein
MSYIGNSPGVASQRVTTTLVATAAQTQFTTQSGYVLGYVDVYLNGAKLVNGSDFEAITGTYITLFAGAALNDVIELVSYVPRGLTDGYTKAEADAKFLDVGGDTATGALQLATASLTGNLTLSGGTANGVGYLNASKVLTTGSGLTFDGTNLNVGTGTVTTTNNFFTATTSGYFFAGNGAFTGGIYGSNSGNYANIKAPTDIISYIGSTEVAHLTSTSFYTASGVNVGIGTSSPSGKLHVYQTQGSMYIDNAGGIPRMRLGGGNGWGFNRISASEDIFFGEPGDTGTWRVRGSGTISLGVGNTSTSMTIVGDGGNVLIGTATNTNSSKLVVAGTISQTVGGTQYLVVDQSDIGTGANKIPLNQHLGSMAYADSANYYNTQQTVGFRNRIINGDMRINQRGTTAQTFNDSFNVWPVDRFTGAALTDGGITGEQSTDAPTGFSNSIKCTVTSADTSLSSTQYARIYLQNEGLNVSDFAWGTTNASPVTLSFWTKSSVVGIYGGTFQNSVRDRSFAFNYTINTANTWEYKTIIIAGDTTGTWLKDNSTGIRIAWGLAAGSTYQQSNVGVWESTGVKFAPSNALNLLATNGATFYITGVQLEKGSIATGFDYRPTSTELALCQRYCHVIRQGSSSTAGIGIGVWSGTASTSGSAYVLTFLPTTMRVIPSITYSSVSDFQCVREALSWETVTGIAIQSDQTSTSSVAIAVGTATSDSRGFATRMKTNSSTAYLLYSAEL